MKKAFALLLAMSLMMGVFFTGCSSQPNTNDTQNAQNTESNKSEESTNATNTNTENDTSDYKVALMIPGNLGDKSFFDAAFNSIELLKSELGIQVDYVESGSDSSKYYSAYVDLCEKNYDLILTVSSNGDDALTQIAEEYPEQKFINLDDTMEEIPANVYIISPKNNEMCYLSGAVAALKAKELGENTIGFVGGMDIPGINEFLVGYIEGAQQINPDIKVAASYVGSFTDTAKGKENGLLLYNSGVSVIFAAAGQSGLGVIDAAVAKEKFAIGVDSDQAEALKEAQPDMANVIITSAIKNIPQTALMIVKKAMADDVAYGTKGFYGLKDGAVGIANNEFYQKLLSESDRNTVSELQAKVVNGEATITDTAGLTTEQVNTIRDAVRP
ncbi:BMP family ABC transporter substrate-binding protein [Fusibacter ferrireducens]|uniref:BMP family ABC transporter substrate-binding protein n=1 Tax=Fusibacter ferrireducens TaxID=2785058 RepID=A0ABR9ZNK5_9FIRM|nr:BMP family ABC transporter substrate-binding protein [Fusibacter ferrireducens]MBF4691989.1 BMP family ABC transporter substrate-binding protein [Fusibacter ferrireducens]